MDWLNPINWLNFLLERPDTTNWKLCSTKGLSLLSPTGGIVYVNIMLYRKYYFLYTINVNYNYYAYNFSKNYARIKSLFEKKELKGVDIMWTSGFCSTNIDYDFDYKNGKPPTNITYWLNLYINCRYPTHYPDNIYVINHKNIYHTNGLLKSKIIKQVFEQIEENNFLKLNIKIL